MDSNSVYDPVRAWYAFVRLTDIGDTKAFPSGWSVDLFGEGFVLRMVLLDNNASNYRWRWFDYGAGPTPSRQMGGLEER